MSRDFRSIVNHQIRSRSVARRRRSPELMLEVQLCTVRKRPIGRVILAGTAAHCGRTGRAGGRQLWRATTLRSAILTWVGGLLDTDHGEDQGEVRRIADDLLFE
jgi:hypothetical protein